MKKTRNHNGGGNALMDDEFVINNLSFILNSRPIKYDFIVENYKTTIINPTIKYFQVVANDKNGSNSLNLSIFGGFCLIFSITEGPRGFTIIIHNLEKCAPISNYGTFILNSLKEFASKYGYYSIKIETDVALLIFQCEDKKQIYIPLSELSILATGESWYNRMGFYAPTNKAEEDYNSFIFHKQIEDIDNIPDLTDFINTQHGINPSPNIKKVLDKECLKMIENYRTFKSIYGVILKITNKKGTDTIQSVFLELYKFIRKNCDEVNRICSVNYTMMKEISCFIEFMFAFLNIQYSIHDLEYIVPSYNTSQKGKGIGTKRKRKTNNKTKKQFLYYPNDPKKSFDVYIDKNPQDTINIKYTTVNDVKKTIEKLEKLYKNKKYSHQRIWQVAMIMKVRLEVLKDKKPEQFQLANNYLKFLSKRTKLVDKERYNYKFHY